MAKPTVLYWNTDLETGGFNTPLRLPSGRIVQGADYFPILQVAGQLCDENFNVIDEIDLMVQPTDEQMSRIGEKNWAFHCKNGFDQEWLDAEKVTIEDAQKHVYQFLKGNLIELGLMTEDDAIPEYEYDNKFIIILHGKSVNFDRTFINFQMPEIGLLLSHQTSDVSAVRSMMRSVPGWPYFLSNTRSTHFALQDCEAARQDALLLREALSGVIVSGCKSLEDMMYPKQDLVSVIGEPEHMGLWDRDVEYAGGITVYHGGNLYLSNERIPKGVPFVEGTKGATWRSMFTVKIINEKFEKVNEGVHLTSRLPIEIEDCKCESRFLPEPVNMPKVEDDMPTGEVKPSWFQRLIAKLS